jgi:hypothetical protein
MYSTFTQFIGHEHPAGRLYIRTGFKPIKLDEFEAEVLGAIGNEPVTMEEIASSSRRYPSSGRPDARISKRLIQPSVLLPRMPCIYLGRYTRWNTEAALIGQASYPA